MAATRSRLFNRRFTGSSQDEWRASGDGQSAARFARDVPRRRCAAGRVNLHPYAETGTGVRPRGGGIDRAARTLRIPLLNSGRSLRKPARVLLRPGNATCILGVQATMVLREKLT